MTEKKKIELIDCIKAWEGTLEHYRIGRGISHWEEVQIVRAIKNYGAELVELALYGARFEKKTERFDPKDYISLGRILERDRNGKERIDLYANAGARHRGLQRQETARVEAKRGELEAERTDPKRVREIIAKAFSGAGRPEEVSEQEIEKRKADQLRRLKESGAAK